MKNPVVRGVAAALLFWGLFPAIGAAAPLAASTATLQADTLLFQGRAFAGGAGDLAAYRVNADTGEVAGEKWSAAENLDARNLDMDPRAIFTYRADIRGGALFSWDHLNEIQKQHLGGDDGEPSGKEILDYIAGDRSLEESPDIRTRESRLGAIVRSRPVFHDGVVYVGANDGMLHAFDANTGDEHFAYIPNHVFENLPRLADPDFSEGAYVDATPFVTEVDKRSGPSWKALVGGLGKGGKGIYCLDVSNAVSLAPTTPDAMALVKWEFTDDSDMGYTTGRPLVLHTRAGPVAVFGNGYDSSREEAVIFVLWDIDTHSPSARKFHTGARGQNGIKGDITAIDADSDGFADFVYAGDLQGNIWKLDIRDESIDNWDFAYGNPHAPQPFFTAKTRSGRPQPVTTAVDVMGHCQSGSDGFILLFGTGDADNVSHPGNTATNTVYGLWDWQQQWEIIGNREDAGADKYFGAFSRPGLEGLENYFGDTYGLPGIRHLKLLGQRVEETRQEKGETWVIMSNRTMDWWDPLTGAGRHVGWFFDLPNAGERVIHNPLFRDGVALVASTIPPKTEAGDGTSVQYMIDACSGGEPALTQVDVNQDEKVTGEDTITDAKGGKRRPAGIMAEGSASFPFILSNFVYIPAPEGDDFQVIRLRKKRSGVTYWYIPDYDW